MTDVKFANSSAVVVLKFEEPEEGAVDEALSRVRRRNPSRKVSRFSRSTTFSLASAAAVLLTAITEVSNARADARAETFELQGRFAWAKLFSLLEGKVKERLESQL